MQTKKEKRKGAEVSITGTIPKERIEAELSKALSRIQNELALPGFRKGKVPVDKVREYVGEKGLWREAAENALNAEAEAILKEHEILPVMPIGASLKSSDANTDVPFEIIAIVAPTCSVDGYKETAESAIKKLEPLDREKEKEIAIASLRQQARAMTKSEGEGPLNDEEAKTLGMENATAAEFFITDEAEHAVENRELQRKRGAIAEALIAKASCDIPRIMITEEANALLEATKKDIASRGLPWNEYLKRTNKTDEGIREELIMPAEKRVALDIIFAEISRAEKIKPDEKEEERLAHALVSQGVDHDQAHNYVRATVMREKVWEVLGARAVEHNHEHAASETPAEAQAPAI